MKKIIINSMLITCMILYSILSFAHCDTRNGPVVKAAMEALRTNNVNLILIWIQPKDEAELKAAFARTILVRKKDKEVQQLADEYFFETAVRLHRMGEGETYTGIKDDPIEPFILSAEKAIAKKSADSILWDLKTRIQNGLDKSLSEVLNSATYNPNDIKAGRQHIARYIQFLHYVEVLYASSSRQMTTHAEHESTTAIAGQKIKEQSLPGGPSISTFLFLVIVPLAILTFITVFVLLQNRKLMFKRYHHDFPNGMAQHLAQ